MIPADIADTPAGEDRVASGLRLAFLISLAPRKLGSLEEWLTVLARSAAQRGHRIDFFGLDPIHPDILATLSQSGASWSTLNDLLRWPIGAIRRLREYHVIHLSLLGAGSRAAFVAYAAYPTAIVYTDHFSRRDYDLSLRAGLKRSGVRSCARARLTTVVGVSEFVRCQAAKHLDLETERTRTIYNGVNTERFEFRPHRLPKAGPVSILAVANLIREKGVHHLIGALTHLDSVHLRIAGEGPQTAELRSLASRLHVDDRVEFLGLRDDVQALLHGCDVFVHPAIWTEAFGLTIAEAMSSGRPVIASRVGAIPELIEHMHTGILVDPGNEEVLASAIRKLVAHPDLAKELVYNARHRVETSFGIDRSASEHLDACEDAWARESGSTQVGG